MIKRTTWILLAVFVLLLAAAWYLQRSGSLEAEETATPTPEQLLLEIQTGSVQSLQIEGAEGERVSLESSAEEGWRLVEPEAEATDTARVESAIAGLYNLRVLNVLDAPPAADVIGLAEPVYTLTVGTADEQQVIQVGSVTPTDTGYYAQVDGGPVYVVSKASLDSVLDLFNTPPILAIETPTSAGTAAPVGSPQP